MNDAIEKGDLVWVYDKFEAPKGAYGLVLGVLVSLLRVRVHGIELAFRPLPANQCKPGEATHRSPPVKGVIRELYMRRDLRCPSCLQMPFARHLDTCPGYAGSVRPLYTRSTNLKVTLP